MKPVRIAGVIALALVLTAAVPTLLGLAPTASDGATVSVLVHARPSEVLAIEPGAEIVEPYDSFALVEATASAIARLEARGITVEPQETSSIIALEAVRFDVRRGEPEIPADLRATPTTGPSLYLVHLIGPVKTKWLTELRSDGVRILQSVPAYGFLVSMDGPTRDTVAARRFVDWIGPYHPAYKLQSRLLGATGTVTVQILTVDTADTDTVVTALSQRGVSPVRFDSDRQGVLAVFTAGEMGIVRARLDASLLPALARMPRVMWIEPWSLPQLLEYNAQALLQTGLAPSDVNARRLWARGITGSGQIVTMGDTGIDFDSNFFRESTGTIQMGGIAGPGSIYNTTDLTRRKLVRYIPMSPYKGIDPWAGGDPEAHKDSVNNGFCPSGHGTSTSGNAAGSDATVGTSLEDGMALEAKVIIEDIGSVAPTTNCPAPEVGDVLTYIPDNYDDLFGPAYGNGSRIHSNSWGAAENGYDLQAMMVDRFIWNHPDMSIFFAAGNGGPTRFTVGSPGTAKSAVAVGGANAYPGQELVNTQSSRGPTADGRLKPDFMTFFSGTTSSSSGDPTDNNTPWATTGFAGTSHSTPLAAGMAALVRQYFAQGYYPTGAAVPANGFGASAALVKATLTASSRKMTGSGANLSENTYPNDHQGFGRLALDDALYVDPGTEVGTRKLWALDQASGLSTGQASDYKIRVNSNTAALRIVMAYSDYPAFPNANPALVNNLNLQVTSPTGDVYKGNVFGIFVVGQSLPNTGSFDTRNPIEGVIVTSPAVGEWTIRVEAANVPAGPQGFAIVAVADLDLGYGDIRLDKKVYTESDTIRIEVHDANAVAPVVVDVRSTVETAPEPVTLTETAPGSAVWRGQINTAFGDPVTDGMLQVSEGGLIEAIYSDANPVHDALATATVDASAPAISDVRAEDITNAGATIKWTTNEPANSKVYYGPDPLSLCCVAFDSGLVTAHALPLVGLQTDVLYYYDVESADGLGHTTLDTNGGAHYSFRTTAVGDILLVIGDGSFPSDRVPMYLDALAKSAWTFNAWDVAVQGDPPLPVLQQYKVVIWQTGLEQYPQPSDAQRTLLKAYLDAGGRLFLTSHDAAWSLCATTANPYYSPTRCQWLRSTLKTVWQVDPSDWLQNIGLPGDPISGQYFSGLPYVGHRSGGFGDEVDNLCRTGGSCVQGGATATYVWRDSGGVATPDHDAIKWESTGPNGTSGIGVWGGTPTKAVVFYFEFTGINFVSGVVSNPARTDILNRTIIWLIGRDHPAVQVRSPNGGEVITSNTVTITWSRQTFGGTSVASQTLYYSDNSGQGWNLIGAVPPGDTLYLWDVSTLPNGGRYRVRVVVQDSGTPYLEGADASDADFMINRPGGDTLGPLIWPGSISIVPNPIVRNALVTFLATADDRNRGYSAIQRAELFAGPAPGVDGMGQPINAADNSFDFVLEDLAWTTTAPWLVGTECFWIHAQDASLNWGPYESRCTTIASTAGVDTIPPSEATIAAASLTGATFNNVLVTWQRAGDEGLIGGTVLYRVMRATALAGPYAQVGLDIPGAGTLTYSFTDTGAGDQAPSPTYFYRVRTVDQGGNMANSTSVAGKYSLDLPAGLSLVSFPLIQSSSAFGVVFQTLLAPTPLRAAWTYDGATQTWLTFSSARGAGQNSLRTVGHAQGVYVDLAVPDRFTVAGVIPASTRISLASGWNLVSFPSFASMTAGQVIAATGASAVLAFDAAALPGQTRAMALGDPLLTGRGYWIEVALPTNWNVPGQ